MYRPSGEIAALPDRPALVSVVVLIISKGGDAVFPRMLTHAK
jgi:hypothetical protein